MFLPFAKMGSIEDLGLGLRWNAATLALEVERPANVLSHLQVGRGSIVAIAHSGTAPFFADLLAVWETGAAAACLDDTLTHAEVIIRRFAAALMIHHPRRPATRLRELGLPRP